MLWKFGVVWVAALETRSGVYVKYCAWHGDGILLIDVASRLATSSYRFIGEQQLQVKHV